MTQGHLNGTRPSIRRRPARALCAGLLLLTLFQSPAALAQGKPPDGGAPPGDSAGGPPAGVPGGASAAGTAMDKLFTALALQPAQAAAWNQYVTRVDGYLQLFYRQKPVQATDTAPQQLARVVDRLQNQLAAIEDIELAVRGLYKVLTPEQCQQADRLLLATLPPGILGSVREAVSDTPSKRSGPPGRGGGGPPGGGQGGF